MTQFQFTHKTPQQQLWECVRDEASRQRLAEALKHIRRNKQTELCLALVAAVRWGIHPVMSNWWLQDQANSLLFAIEPEPAKAQNKSIYQPSKSPEK